jgi:citrate lyase subunit beta/citryl-CoA lyase
MRSLLLISKTADFNAGPDGPLHAGADAIVVDVATGSGDTLAAALAFMRDARQVRDRPSIYVRIPVLDDPSSIGVLDAAIGAGADGVVLPNAHSGHDVTRLDARISVEEAVHAIDQGVVRIIAEAADTAKAVQGLLSFRGASHRLTGMIWSADRLADDLGGISVLTPDGHLRAPLATARGLFLIAAAAAGVAPISDSSADRPAKSTGDRYRNAHADGFSAGLTRDPNAVGEIAAIMSAPRG